jgi:probable F420-dependent oxidoreductase
MTALEPASFPQIGILFYGTDTSYPLIDFALAIEERGFDSILLPEHTHMPVQAQYPVGELPDRYRRVLDPYVGLAMVAARTNLKLATAISLIAQHDPIALAKTIATLDHLSGGRFTLGIGYGWNQPELENHGHDFDKRRAIARDYLELMRVLWREDEAEYSGPHASVSRSWAWPKPPRERSVPVLLGVIPSERGFADVIRRADGWLPGGDNPELMAGWLETLRRGWAEAGRAESGPIIWPMLGVNAVLDEDTLRSRLETYAALGVDQVVLDMQAVSKQDTMATLDRYAKVRAEFTQ